MIISSQILIPLLSKYPSTATLSINSSGDDFIVNENTSSKTTEDIEAEKIFAKMLILNTRYLFFETNSCTVTQLSKYLRDCLVKVIRIGPPKLLSPIDVFRFDNIIEYQSLPLSDISIIVSNSQTKITLDKTYSFTKRNKKKDELKLFKSNCLILPKERVYLDGLKTKEIKSLISEDIELFYRKHLKDKMLKKIEFCNDELLSPEKLNSLLLSDENEFVKGRTKAMMDIIENTDNYYPKMIPPKISKEHIINTSDKYIVDKEDKIIKEGEVRDIEQYLFLKQLVNEKKMHHSAIKKFLTSLITDVKSPLTKRLKRC